MSGLSPLRQIGRLRRRLFGRYELDDPRPVAAENPYTYFLPSSEQLAALQVGDDVKLIFRSIPPAPEWGAERMWVRITGIAPHGLTGELNNDPSDMPQLKVGAPVSFQPWHIIDIEWSDAAKAEQFPPHDDGRVWDRCMVDAAIVEDGEPIGFLYRETGDLGGPDDRFPDSGWRIRVAEPDDRDPLYVALGLVLNRDDSILPLLGEPIGARFIRDPKSGGFVPEG
jgi:hypothetical protein